MNTQELMKAIVSDPVSIKQFMLTERQAQIVRFIVRKTYVNSSEIAKRFGLSVPNASVSLHKLHQKGYLGKVKIPSATGGIEFIYIPAPEISLINSTKEKS